MINIGLSGNKKKLIDCCLLLITYYLLITIFSSCKEPAPQIPANKLEVNPINEYLMNFNKESVEFQNEEINHYIDSLNLVMNQTPSGLRYQIINEGEGKPFQKKDKVTFSYSIRTLDNTECKELQNRTKTIELGKSEIETGIEEAVMLLRISGKGQFILPSYLAFGISGYKNCIPALTPVFCEINIIDGGINR